MRHAICAREKLFDKLTRMFHERQFLITIFTISKRMLFVHYYVRAIIAINVYYRVSLYDNKINISNYKIHLKNFIIATIN